MREPEDRQTTIHRGDLSELNTQVRVFMHIVMGKTKTRMTKIDNSVSGVIECSL